MGRRCANADGTPTPGYDRRVTEYQVTYWRDLPSMVVARDGEQATKASLPPRFMEAIDEAAMRLGADASEDYLAGWRRGDWIPSDEDPERLTERVVAELEATWGEDAVTAYLDGLGAPGDT